MEAARLREIVDRKNERLEENAVRTAECLIEGIVEQQKRIKVAQDEIAQLRKELAELQIPQLDQAAILG